MHESYPERKMDDLTDSDELRAASEPTGYGAPEPGGSPGGETTEKVQDQAGQAVSKAQEQAGQAVSKIQHQAAERAAGQKDRLAEGLGSAADALTQMSRQLHDSHQDTIANVADMAADRVRQMSDYLRRHEVGDLMDDVEDFARRQPALVLGGAFALGVLTARFLKSSSPSSGRTSRRGMGSRTGYGDSMVQESPSYRPSSEPGYRAGQTRSTGVD